MNQSKPTLMYFANTVFSPCLHLNDDNSLDAESVSRSLRILAFFGRVLMALKDEWEMQNLDMICGTGKEEERVRTKFSTRKGMGREAHVAELCRATSKESQRGSRTKRGEGVRFGIKSSPS
jgi:hypothetical protein